MQVGDISKKGWSQLAGNNISSPTGGYGSNSDNFNASDSGYQRSNSTGKISGGTAAGGNVGGDDWNWNEDAINSNNS